jgi:homoserine kinase
MAGLAQWLAAAGASAAGIVAAVAVENRHRCEPPLDDDDLLRIVGEVVRRHHG